MTQYVSLTTTQPQLRAWLMPDDPQDSIDDPLVKRDSGWRLIIETTDENIKSDPVRSAWEFDIGVILGNMEDYWNEKPVWRRVDNGKIVDLYAILGIDWNVEE